VDIQQLKNFLILCETLNFRKASEHINIVQPALSRQIQSLEESVGALLFSRNKRNVALTEAGIYFRKESNRIIHELEKAIEKTSLIHRGEAGEISIGNASSAMQTVVPSFLVKAKERFPDLKTNLLEMDNRKQIEMLINRESDLGVGPNILVPTEINYRVLYQENFVILLPQNHSISSDNFTDISMLKDENFILPPLSVGYGYVETIQQMCQKYGFKPKVVHESAHSSSVQRLVEAGLGISIEPISSVKGMSSNIKLIELKDEPQKAEMMLLWLKEREDELRNFLDLF
jgi:DNA-binding transcriptional LysR family regulator